MLKRMGEALATNMPAGPAIMPGIEHRRQGARCTSSLNWAPGSNRGNLWASHTSATMITGIDPADLQVAPVRTEHGRKPRNDEGGRIPSAALRSSGFTDDLLRRRRIFPPGQELIAEEVALPNRAGRCVGQLMNDRS
jgi:hypothetical protein